MLLDSLGGFTIGWNFVVALVSIVLIDLVLAGDNAVVIAMAVRSLSPKKRKKGIIIGAGFAVVLRVALTFVAAQLLSISGIKFFGGLLITWIAIKLFMEGAPQDKFQNGATTLKQAVFTIMIADLVMSTDNILAVAGASEGNLFLLLFGLGISIPFVVFTSNLLSGLMDKYPFILYIGAGILGRVAGDMMISDPFVQRFLHPNHLVDYFTQALFAVGVILVGKFLLKLKAQKAPIMRTFDDGDELLGVFSK